MFGKSFLTAAAIGAIAIAAPASATTTIETSGTIDLRGNGGNGSYGNSRTFSDGSTSVTATGWSIDNQGVVRQGALGRWDRGLGVLNSSTDNSHTVDNSGWIDFVVFQFNTSVALDQVSFFTGFNNLYDTDATIGFGNLASAFAGDLSNFSFYDLPGMRGNNVRGVNPNGSFGNTWIVGASAVNTDGHADGFKIGGFTYDTAGAVPEPATWAMMLLGFGFAGAAMRRTKEKTRMTVSYA
ncbi:PEP-CTERM sorting domain-containing protein [Erythrobacter litoralis]|nr:PEPxxWA-CTERM sorting domain-containing protein [Erythrobacter litoralis]MDG6078588.1 PEP-CTERM sorting domain-containing protein [Erythrobacter litoralis]